MNLLSPRDLLHRSIDKGQEDRKTCRIFDSSDGSNYSPRTPCVCAHEDSLERRRGKEESAGSRTVRSCDGPRVDRSRSKTPPSLEGLYLRPRSHRMIHRCADFLLAFSCSPNVEHRTNAEHERQTKTSLFPFPSRCFTSLNGPRREQKRGGFPRKITRSFFNSFHP